MWSTCLVYTTRTTSQAHLIVVKFSILIILLQSVHREASYHAFLRSAFIFLLSEI